MDGNFHKANCKGFYDEEKIIENLIDFIGNSKIISRYSQFDMQFNNKELSFRNLQQIDSSRFICSILIIKYLVEKGVFQKKIKGFKLLSCCELLEINFDNKRLHSVIYYSLILVKFITKIVSYFPSSNPNLNPNCEITNVKIQEEEIISLNFENRFSEAHLNEIKYLDQLINFSFKLNEDIEKSYSLLRLIII